MSIQLVSALEKIELILIELANAYGGVNWINNTTWQVDGLANWIGNCVQKISLNADWIDDYVQDCTYVFCTRSPIQLVRALTSCTRPLIQLVPPSTSHAVSPIQLTPSYAEVNLIGASSTFSNASINWIVHVLSVVNFFWNMDTLKINEETWLFVICFLKT